MAKQYFVNHFLALDRQFQRHPQIKVVKRRHIHTHREGVMQIPGVFDNIDVWCPCQQGDSLGIDPVDGIDVAVHQGILTRGYIQQRQDFNLIKMRAPLFEVVGVARSRNPDTRIITVQDVTTGANSRQRINRPVAQIGHDRQVIVADNEREVGVAGFQSDHNSIAVLGDIGDRGQKTLRSRSGIFTAVEIKRRDDIIGGQCLAVVKFDALTHFKPPGCGIGAGFPAFGQFWNKFGLIADFGQMTADQVRQNSGHTIFIRAGIHRIGSRAVANANPEQSTLIWRCRSNFVCHGERGWQHHPGSKCRHHKLTPVNLAGAQFAFLYFQIFFSHYLTPLFAHDKASSAYCCPVLKSRPP